MPVTPATHPTPEQLSAFTLGKLTEANAAAIARHLEDCAVCRQAVGKVPADSFVGLVRSVREPSSTPLPAGKLGELQPVTTDDMGELPPEMTEHARYRLVRELGRGGMGAVYLAEHKMMGRRVAIKVLNRNVLEKPEALDRFRQEVQVAGKLDHPHIVRAYDADEAGGLHLLVMEYVEGISLAQAVQKKGPLPVTHACHYVRQAALGLQHAFEQGMVHRDIKPANLMLTPKGQVKILDFGLARLRSEQQAGTGLTQDGAFMGTPDYIAPEQATDARQADIRADVYSLGCTLYYLLAGKPPFEGQTAVQLILAHLEKEPPPLEKVRKDIPAELAAAVQKMMAKEPGQRYQTPIEVAQVLAPFCKAAPKPAAQPAPTPGPLAAASPHSKTVKPTDTSKLPVAKEKPAEKPAAKAPLPPKKKQRPMPSSDGKRLLAVGAAIAAVLVLAVGVVLLAPIIIKVKTPNGTVVLEIDQAGAEVFVDGTKINVTVPGDRQPLTIEVPPKRDGRHMLKVTKGGFQAYTQEITVQPGKPEQVKVTLVPETKVAVNPPEKPIVPVTPDTGWVSLVNGKDLTGWKTHPGETSTWKVDKGVLVGKGPGPSTLFTQRDDYTDFHARLEARTNGTGSAGLFFRYAFDKFSHPKRHPIGYLAMLDTHPDQVLRTQLGFHCAMAPATEPQNTGIRAGEWFRLEVIAQGRQTRILVDGVERVNFTDARGFFTRGHLALGVIGGSGMEVRKVEVKELSPAPPSADPPKPAEQAWVPLFNGKDLNGWKVMAGKADWYVEQGVLVGRGPQGVLLHERTDFSNFRLRVETRLSEGRFSFVVFRYDSVGKYRIKICGSEEEEEKARTTGSLDTTLHRRVVGQPLADASEVPLKPGEWFWLEVKADGNRITVLVNNQKVVDFTDPENRHTAGQIGIHHFLDSVVRFRRIEIQELPPSKPAGEKPPE